MRKFFRYFNQMKNIVKIYKQEEVKKEYKE